MPEIYKQGILITLLVSCALGGKLKSVLSSSSVGPRKAPAQGISPVECIDTRSKQEGICMFAWHCNIFKGIHLNACYDGVFVGSCCKLPPGLSTTIGPPAVVTESPDSNSIPSVLEVGTPTSINSEQSNEIIPSMGDSLDNALGRPVATFVEHELTTGRPSSGDSAHRPLNEPVTSTSIVTSFTFTNSEATDSTSQSSLDMKPDSTITSNQVNNEATNLPTNESTFSTKNPDGQEESGTPLSNYPLGPNPTTNSSTLNPNSAPSKPKPVYERVTPKPVIVPSPLPGQFNSDLDDKSSNATSNPKNVTTQLPPRPATPRPTRRPTPTRRPPRPTTTRKPPPSRRPTPTRRPSTTTRRPTTRRPPTRTPTPRPGTRRPPSRPTPTVSAVVSPVSSPPSNILTTLTEQIIEVPLVNNSINDPAYKPPSQISPSNHQPSGTTPSSTIITTVTTIITTPSTTVRTTSVPSTVTESIITTVTVPITEVPTTTEAILTTTKSPVTASVEPVTNPVVTTRGPETTLNTTFTITTTNISHVLPTNMTTVTLANVTKNPPFKEVCGKPVLGPQGRIVGGENAHYAEWPWMISLRQWKKNTFLHKCGAALLNEFWAVSAAHCVENVSPTDLLLRLGEYDVNSEKEPEVYEERRVQIVASHPKFDPRTFEYDLALLRFYEPVKFQRNILPICIPGGDDLFVEKTATVTGWGRLHEDGPLPHIMQKVQVPVITNKECESMYRKAGFVEDIPDIFICAGKAEGGRDSCEGDSGGPMVLKSEGRWVLAGIISWGIGCALPNQPGVYTRISKFASWVDQIIAF